MFNQINFHIDIKYVIMYNCRFTQFYAQFKRYYIGGYAEATIRSSIRKRSTGTSVPCLQADEYNSRIYRDSRNYIDDRSTTTKSNVRARISHPACAASLTVNDVYTDVPVALHIAKYCVDELTHAKCS